MRRLSTFVSLVVVAAAAAAQPPADPATSFRMRPLLDAGAWERAIALGRLFLAADTTTSAERCRVLEGVAYAHLMATRADSARATIATFDAACRDVPLDRATRAEAARIRRAVASANGG